MPRAEEIKLVTSHLSIANVQVQNFGGVNQLSDFLRMIAAIEAPPAAN